MGCHRDRRPTGTAARRDGVRKNQRENDRVVSVYAVDSLSGQQVVNEEVVIEEILLPILVV
jgi:hypothetical protein